MLVLAGFAFLSGIITILSPCILPVLPVVLAGSAGGGRQRPLGIITGFVISFTVFTVTLAALTRSTGISADALRWVAIAVLGIFGLVMIVPRFSHWFELLAGRMTSGFQPGAGKSKGKTGVVMKEVNPVAAPKKGFLGGIPVGMSLGILWTPCVGPILASVITLALASSIDAGAFFITLAYSLGTAIPMAAIMLGGRRLLQKVPWLTGHMDGIRKGFGVLMIFLALAISFGWDRTFQNAVLQAFPGYGKGLTAIENSRAVTDAIDQRESSLTSDSSTLTYDDGVFKGSGSDRSLEGVPGTYGSAPALVASGPWINSAPLTMNELKGKVVLIDFWTYSCINCIRTMPYLKDWQKKYADDGLVIIGVHSPEFAFEHDPDNVRTAVKNLGIDWPVVLDNSFAQWRSYSNRFWPAHYLIDATGQVRYFSYGEGDYRGTEQMIQSLLIEAGHTPTAVLGSEVRQAYAGTPETYLGTRRAKRYAGTPDLSAGEGQYKGPAQLALNEWSLSGNWNISPEYAMADGADSTVNLHFQARKVYAVLAPPQTDAGGQAGQGPAMATVRVDGGKTKEIQLDVSRMYELTSLMTEGRHMLQLQLPAGAKIYTFTFGG